MSYDRQRRCAVATGYVRMFRAYGTLFGMGFDEVYTETTLRALEDALGPYYPARYERLPLTVADAGDPVVKHSELPDLFMAEHLESLERLCA